MLDKHLIAKTSPLANAENIILWKSYRVTVLQDRLFRVERSEEGIFRDDATLRVWFRDMPKQEFSFADKGEYAIITTPKCSLVLKERREDCFVEFHGVRAEISNEGNLLGTYRTLDNCDGNILYSRGEVDGIVVPLEYGVCSKSGVAVFDDAKTVTLLESGEVSPKMGNGTDEYVFAYEDDYREAVKALYLITGPVPMIPRYALGNWWSRYHEYTDKSYLRLLTDFEEHNVPLTVATIDMDWHYSKDMDKEFRITEQGRNTDFYGGMSGWTGYSWNRHLFPDYKTFLQKIKEKNLKITLNLHPASGFRWWEDMYEDMARAVGIDPTTLERVPFDIASTDFINAYFSIAHKPYERDGVEFWWIDWQQQNTTKVEGLDPLWSLNHYHYLDNAQNHDVPMILSRYAGIGSHRYPLGFSGDTYMSWNTLAYLPYFTYTASNVGYTWWSHDIGGHQRGVQQNELYLRHIQLGVFLPINRLHSTDLPTNTKEPWIYGNGCGELAQEYLRLRHKMIPYLYSESYRMHKDGLALIEPLYYVWKDEEAYEDNHSYLFGGQFLVAPAVTPAEGDGYTRIKVWLPEGKWTDIFTGDEYNIPAHGRKTTLYRDLTSIPVLAKEGAILPLSKDTGNSCENPTLLEIWAFSGDGEYSLYEDKENSRALTSFVMKREGDRQTLVITASTDGGVIPKNRSILVRFKNISEGTVTVTANGAVLPTEELYLKEAAVKFEFDAKKTYEITVVSKPQSEKEKRTEHAKQVLLRAEGAIPEQVTLYNKLCAAEDEAEYVAAVNSSSVGEIVKLRLKETL